MRENRESERTPRGEGDREQVLRLMNESGEPAPVDMTLFSRRTGQIIARSTASDRRDHP
jgi:hypothetical protein